MGQLIFSGCFSVLLSTFPDTGDKRAAAEIVQQLNSKKIPSNVDSRYPSTEKGVKMTDTHIFASVVSDKRKENW